MGKNVASVVVARRKKRIATMGEMLKPRILKCYMMAMPFEWVLMNHRRNDKEWKCNFEAYAWCRDIYVLDLSSPLPL
jgi:hypothetical protein